MTNLESSVEALVAQHAGALPPESIQFLRRVFAGGLGRYRARLSFHGFTGLESVLDAGCGFGQWTTALAECNHRVVGIEASEPRVAFARDLVRLLGLSNSRIECCRLETLPFDDGTFEGIFCYGVLFLTDWRASLRELARVLRSGGRLYVNANGLGWYKHLWYSAHNVSPGYDPRWIAANVLLDTLRYERGEKVDPGHDLLIEPRELEAALSTAGFGDIRCGPEGTVPWVSSERPPLPPFFRGEFEGDTGVYEILCRKQ